MFDPFTNTQPVADLFKAFIDKTPGTERRLALQAVSRFETCAWHPRVMKQAVAEITPDVISITNGELTVTGEKGLAAARHVLETYADLITGATALFSTDEAAEYLGIKPVTLRYHIYEAGNIEGARVGNSFVFTRRQLWEFERRRRKQGRPSKVGAPSDQE